MDNYEFARTRSDLLSRYAQENAAQEYGRFLGQQRFSRNLSDLNQAYTRGFPSFTGQWARRLGSNVKSGVFGEKLGQNVQDFRQRQQDVTAEQAAFLSDFERQKALRDAALKQALLDLQSNYQRSTVGF